MPIMKTMKDVLCVDKMGNGCKHCKLFRKQTMMKCVKGLWDRGNGTIKLSQSDYMDDGTICPRVRQVLKTAERCEWYEGV